MSENKPIQISTPSVKYFYFVFCIGSLVLAPLCPILFDFSEAPTEYLLLIAFTLSFLFTSFLLFFMADAKLGNGELHLKKIGRESVTIKASQIVKLSKFKINKIMFGVIWITDENGNKQKYYVPAMKSKFGAASVDPYVIINDFKKKSRE